MGWQSRGHTPFLFLCFALFSLSFPLMVLPRLVSCSSFFIETQRSLSSECEALFLVLPGTWSYVVCISCGIHRGIFSCGQFLHHTGSALLIFFLYLFQGQHGAFVAVLKWWSIECRKCSLKLFLNCYVFEIVW